MQTDTATTPTLVIELPNALNNARYESDRSNWRHRLVLRPASRTVSVWSMYGSGTPIELYNNVAVGLCNLPDGLADLTPVQRVLEAHTDYLLELSNTHTVEWKNGDRRGSFADSDRALDLLEQIFDAVTVAAGSCSRFWDAGEWLARTDDSDLFPAGFAGTDAALEARARELVEESRGDAALDVDDVEKLLRRRWAQAATDRAEEAESTEEAE